MSENLTLQHEAQNADQLAYEINFIKRQTYEYVLKASVDIGERLTAAKELVPYGGWADWLKEKVDYSQSTANNLMRIYKEFSDDQISLSGKTKSQTFGNLTYSQAVALFALPEHQREEFVEQHDVSDMSVKELKEAIAAQKAAEAERDEAEEAQREAEEQLDAANEQMKNLRHEIGTLKTEKGKISDKFDSLQARHNVEKEKTKRLQKELDAANEQLKELTSTHAEISDEDRAEIEEAVERKFEDQLSQMTIDVQTEKARAEAITAEKAALEEKLRQVKSDEAIRLDILFRQAQATMMEIKGIIDGCAEDKRQKYNDFVKSTLLKLFGG